jgi:hypothetical protein
MAGLSLCSRAFAGVLDKFWKLKLKVKRTNNFAGIFFFLLLILNFNLEGGVFFGGARFFSARFIGR